MFVLMARIVAVFARFCKKHKYKRNVNPSVCQQSSTLHVVFQMKMAVVEIATKAVCAQKHEQYGTIAA